MSINSNEYIKEKIENHHQFDEIFYSIFKEIHMHRVDEIVNFKNISDSLKSRFNSNSLKDIRDEIKKEARKSTFNYIISNYFIDENIIIEFFPFLDPDLVCKFQLLSEEFIEMFKYSLDWQIIYFYQYHIREEFFEKHNDQIDFGGMEHEEDDDEGYDEFVDIFNDDNNIMNDEGIRIAITGSSPYHHVFDNRDRGVKKWGYTESYGFFKYFDT